MPEKASPFFLGPTLSEIAARARRLLYEIDQYEADVAAYNDRHPGEEIDGDPLNLIAHWRRELQGIAERNDTTPTRSRATTNTPANRRTCGKN